MPFAETGRLSIYHEVAGEGRPVLYIGGTGGDLRQQPNVFASPLAKTARLVAYDQRGLGRTAKPAGPYSMADYADDAAALLDHLELDRVDVVGVSFGGMVALNFALRHAARLRRLVLCCTSPGGRLPSYPFHELPDGLDAGERVGRLLDVNDLRLDATWQRAHPDVVARLVEQARSEALAADADDDARRGARLQIEARAGHDVLDRLGEIQKPTLVCAGRYDGIAPAASQRALEAGLPDVRVRWYEGGHMFLLQDRSAWRDILGFIADGEPPEPSDC